MRKRYLYGLLWGVPGLFIAGIVTTTLFGMLLGVLWLYVFGDHPWPVSTEPFLAALGLVTFLGVWIGLILQGYRLGKKLESNPGLDRRHILLSAGLTVMFMLYMLVQQWSVGNLGPRPDSLVCSDFCVQRGYAGSGMPPADSAARTCSCYDESGNEAVKIPFESIGAEIVK